VNNSYIHLHSPLIIKVERCSVFNKTLRVFIVVWFRTRVNDVLPGPIIQDSLAFRILNVLQRTSTLIVDLRWWHRRPVTAAGNWSKQAPSMDYQAWAAREPARTVDWLTSSVDITPRQNATEVARTLPCNPPILRTNPLNYKEIRVLTYWLWLDKLNWNDRQCLLFVVGL
jgi:hypothetical protein